ncbi:hypothetical protein F5B22DRAFT_656183 [Xylaria bambusicola]|uniref:uncharacterized protein n=1 Tax=Xylaria bambusicola TaxID=326684 RepID=UPI002008B167|nr:uncharacterized protein F5B22DRAFT_656183 [Xylaria bambusicola]KAI0515256.1 hypothetical protein F5B22DRAFT_656183 [Xylaria bambusicola]
MSARLDLDNRMFGKTPAGAANSEPPLVTERPLICSSLRKRLDWVTLFTSLLRNHSPCGKWKETQLETYDVAIPLTSQRVFRAIFISSQDAASPDSLARTERLYNLNAGQLSGIIFLLKHDDEQQSAVHALMTLQTQLISGGWVLPIYPVDSVAAVPAILVTICSQLCSPAVNREPASSASYLLPFCSDNVLLTGHTVNILTDTTSDFENLLNKLSTNTVLEPDIALLLGDDADKLRSFWAGDSPVD